MKNKVRNRRRRGTKPKDSACPSKDSDMNLGSIDSAHAPGLEGNDTGSTKPTPAISGNTAEDRQRTHAALDTSRTNTAGLLADGSTGFRPPLDSNPALCEDLVTSSNSATPKILGPTGSGVLSPPVHHAGIEGELYPSQHARPLGGMGPIAITGNGREAGENNSLWESVHRANPLKMTEAHVFSNAHDIAVSGGTFYTANTINIHEDEATKTLQLDLAWSTERKVDNILAEFRLTRLDPLLARKAIYDADLGAGATVTREPCTAGTREGILKEIIAWADDISADSPPVFWLTGQAGAGKTTIAYTIAEHFDELEDSGRHTVLGGNFLCSRQFEETRRQIHIIPTLVYQLARKSRSYADALHEADRFDSVNKPTKQMKDLLVGPWQHSESGRHVELPPYLIVVDALDEIEADGGSLFLQSLLETINQRRLRGLKFLITSRPDRRVEDLCKTFSSKAVCRLQDVPIERVGLDINRYLESKFPNFVDRPELKTMEQLAGGLFIAAATIVRYLTPCELSESEQSKLLNSLHDEQTLSPSDTQQPLLIDNLYQQIMLDAFSNLPENLFNSRLCILHTFLCTFERTPASLTAALLSESVDTAMTVLKKLHAVFYSKDGRVLWYHASFPDFIFSHTRSTFKLGGCRMSMTCDQAQHHAFLTKCCFDRMKESLRFNIGEITSSFLLDTEDPKLMQRVDTNIKLVLRYACRHWAQHLAQTGQKEGEDLSDYITDFLCVRILFWIEAMNLLGSSGQCTTMLQHTREWVLKNMNKEAEFAADIAEAANFATYFTANPPALSTPHLYISALASWSTGSTISQQWRSQFCGIPSFIHRKASDLPLIRIQTAAPIFSVAFSTDSTRIVSGSKDKSVRVWDASTGAELKVLNGHMKAVNSVAFSTDGTRIVSGSVWDASTGAELKVLNGHKMVWDASTGAELKVLNGHMKAVNSVAFSTDGTRIVSGSYDKSVRVWDVSTGAELKVLNGHMEAVKSVAFSTDGTCIVSGSSDKSVQVWDASTGAELKVLNGHKYGVNSVAFSTDGTHIVSGSSDKSVRVWDASTGAELKVLNGHMKAVNSVAFSTDGTRIVSGSYDKSVRVWDVSTGAELKVLNGHMEAVKSVAFSTDGTCIVSGSSDKSVQVWDASTGAELKVLNGHKYGVNSVAFSTDGTHIVSGSSDKSVRVWDASTGAELKVLNGHMKAVNSVAFSTDGTRIISGSYDKSVRVWDVSTGAELKVLNGHMKAVNSVAFSTDGTRIVSGSYDKSVRVWDASTGAELKVWDASTGAELKVLNGHMEAVCSVAFSTDGTRIVSGSYDKSVRVWDVSTGAELKVLNGHMHRVKSVAFSTDGTCIVSGSSDKSVQVWDASTGAELKVLNGHKYGVNSVAFSTDGTHIVSGSSDKSVRVWDASTGAELKVLNGHMKAVNSVAFSTDGTRIVSGSADSSVRVWDALTGAEARVPNIHTHSHNSIMSPVGITSHNESAQLSNIDHAYPPWTIDQKLWVRSVLGEYRLMWVPEVAYPYTLLVISREPSAIIIFGDCKIGRDWAGCYTPT
ncbi:mycorrhiza-induced NACHT/WD-repeat protein [Laccaria bicolor S238N-H82]|uniref:Mycorrhiza-induced NACHT/WD-repeat protein n=1 Tax=Laccaria bicolor (strain S238N-H82 / ATCC MYA-4686) TaxID=486041 RepID=B0D529_LACBS|nr:mycorrhiza-induced NACHT/WD-repeat protein [Laccaria bicolor S238N-H82]EDR10450.1 mycorrhiza-induced NACHT/WD-repeat protein [Laccaria bicolor S238N-H82]|eukprot:XP_001878900.1 mycorrhiza-induced NACHT/WD-repeat protein [Laccaria bicolor S238N-H82]